MSNFFLITFISLICKIRKPPVIIIGFEYSFNFKPNKALLILELNEFSSIQPKRPPTFAVSEILYIEAAFSNPVSEILFFICSYLSSKFEFSSILNKISLSKNCLV